MKLCKVFRMELIFFLCSESIGRNGQIFEAVTKESATFAIKEVVENYTVI